MNIEQAIKQKLATIVDVRSTAEFMGGHIAGSINIPLQEVPERIEELKALQSPLILCCASGSRSRHAQQYLTQLGLECFNGGSWLDINYLQVSKENRNNDKHN